jgi:hypothetical protein
MTRRRHSRWFNKSFVGLVWTLALGVSAMSLAGEPKTISIFQGRKIEIPVPKGWSYEERPGPHDGSQTVVLADKKKEVLLTILFLPDADGALSTREGLEQQAKRILTPYLEQAVEKKLDFTFFESPDGVGVFTSFTDNKLDPKHIPEDEKLISTTGLRSWNGAGLFFTLLTNSRDLPAYETALDIVRSGIRQVKAPVAF